MAEPAAAVPDVPSAGWACPACRAAYGDDVAACPRDGSPRSGATDALVGGAAMARSLAGLVAAAASLAAGVWLAALLGALGAPLTSGRRALVGAIAVAAIAGAAVLHVRALRPVWSSAPAVLRRIQPSARALVAGVLTFGGLELVATGLGAVLGVAPLVASARVVLAGVAAALGLGWRRMGLDASLRRRLRA